MRTIILRAKNLTSRRSVQHCNVFPVYGHGFFFFFISSHTFVRIYIGARFWKSDRVRVIKGSARHYARNPLLVIVRVRVFDRLRVSDKTYRNEHLPDWGREGEEGRKGRNYRIRCALQMREYTVYTGRRE